MTKYHVHETYEYYVTYEVEASSLDDAQNILSDGDPDFFKEIKRSDSECLRVDVELAEESDNGQAEIHPS